VTYLYNITQWEEKKITLASKETQRCNTRELVKRQHTTSGTCHFLLQGTLLDKQQSTQIATNNTKACKKMRIKIAAKTESRDSNNSTDKMQQFHKFIT